MRRVGDGGDGDDGDGESVVEAVVGMSNGS